VSARPDLARYLALPPGYGFDARNGERIWFDEQELQEHLAEFAKDKNPA
jgi:hypothetical protein